jgi:hypothetical protein
MASRYPIAATSPAKQKAPAANAYARQTAGA